MPSYATQPVFNATWGEPMTHTRAGVGTATTFTGCRYPKGSGEGATSFGVYTIRKETFTFDRDAIGAGVRPKPRDTITPSDGIARVITDVIEAPFLRYWKCEAQVPELASDLDQLATVYRPVPTPSAAGLRTANLAAVYTATPCRLQPGNREFEPVEALGKSMVTRANFTCIFSASVVLNAGDVIEVSGVKYEATGQQDVESLGVLTFAECTRIS